MTDEQLIDCFEAGDEPPGGFHHPEHVRVAWWYARRHPWTVALQHFQSALRRFAAARGKPERYHETITAAFMVLVCERLARVGRGAAGGEVAAANRGRLAGNPSILDRYYRPETLASD